MKYQKNGPYYQLKLEPGDEIIPMLSRFIRDLRIKSGILFGLGAGTDLELGYYHLKKKSYHRRRFQGEFEICSLVGNIAWADKEPILHLHAVISNNRLTTYSGHLFAGRVTVTCEIAVIAGKNRLRRQLDPGTGLKLLEL